MNSTIAGFANAWKELKLRLIRWGISSMGTDALVRLQPRLFLKKRLQRHEDAMFSALGGVMSFHFLRTAYRIGLFKLLHTTPGMQRLAIAQALGTTDYALEILLLGLAPMNLIHKVGDKHFNNPFLSSMLSGEMNDEGMGKFIDYFHHVINPAMTHLEESVRRSRPVGLHALFGEQATDFYQEVAQDTAVNSYFEPAMRADTRFNRDAVAADKLFGECASILDVGGSTGELATAIARRHRSTKVTVFDFPEVVARTRERFRDEGLADRLATVSGNMLLEEFPRGYDCVILAHLIEKFSPERVRGILRKAYACLPQGGRVVVFGSAVDDDESGPLSFCVFSAYFFCLADGEGRIYSARQTADAMREAGFVRIRRKTLPINEALVVGVKP